MKLLACVLLACGLVLPLAAASPDLPQFVDLFNGKDLTGWVNVNTDPDTWSVQDGMLVCTGQPIGVMRSGSSTRTSSSTSSGCTWKPGGNSGVFVWSDARPDADEPPAQRHRSADAGARLAEAEQGRTASRRPSPTSTASCSAWAA